ncbi:MAG: replicative DNA helicase, partial [Proteobacteria bacterium]|nr:replicative DNA helicase [Pseudomonadota bacterium]
MEPVSTVRPLRPPEPATTGFERLPPHNDEAEMALLGAILHNNRAFERVADFLKPEHFASRVHGRIFEAIARLVDRGQIADPITLKQYFEADADLSEIGGYQYLMRLAGSVASIVNAEDYGRTVHDLHLRR